MVILEVSFLSILIDIIVSFVFTDNSLIISHSHQSPIWEMNSRFRLSTPLQLTYSFQPHYDPGVDSASNRNEYEEFSWGLKAAGLEGLTTLPPSMSRMSGNVGASTSRNPKGLHGLYRENFTLLFDYRYRRQIYLSLVTRDPLHMTLRCTFPITTRCSQ
jgi:hypothetical protein